MTATLSGPNHKIARLCQVLIEHGQALHEVHGQEVVGVFCGVDWVPEHICIRVGANRVPVATSQGSQEGWALVAGT